jgi:hypothetical protein
MTARELFYMSSMLLVASSFTKLYRYGYKYYIDKDKPKKI